MTRSGRAGYVPAWATRFFGGARTLTEATLRKNHSVRSRPLGPVRDGARLAVLRQLAATARTVPGSRSARPTAGRAGSPPGSPALTGSNAPPPGYGRGRQARPSSSPAAASSPPRATNPTLISTGSRFVIVVGRLLNTSWSSAALDAGE